MKFLGETLVNAAGKGHISIVQKLVETMAVNVNSVNYVSDSINFYLIETIIVAH